MVSLESPPTVGEGLLLLLTHSHIGPIMQFFVPGKSILVLSDVEDAHYLLGKKGSNYSDRPRPVLHGEL